MRLFSSSERNLYSAKLFIKSAYFTFSTMNAHSPIDCGFGQFDALEHDNHHAHQEYVITFMQAGYVVFCGEQDVNIKPGMLTLVPSGMPHALLKGKDIKVYWLSFTADSIQLDESHELMRLFAQIRKGALPVFKLSKDRINYVISLFREICNELTHGQSAKVLESLVCLLLHEANKASKLSAIDLGPATKVGQALQYIQEHSSEGISLKDVAAALYISPNYLATKVKQSTGYTVGQWINQHRLKKALELLAHTDKKIDQISVSLGWQDVTHFIRLFKKAYHQTPAAWRRQQRFKE